MRPDGQAWLTCYFTCERMHFDTDFSYGALSQVYLYESSHSYLSTGMSSPKQSSVHFQTAMRSLACIPTTANQSSSERNYPALPYQTL